MGTLTTVTKQLREPAPHTAGCTALLQQRWDLNPVCVTRHRAFSGPRTGWKSCPQWAGARSGFIHQRKSGSRTRGPRGPDLPEGGHGDRSRHKGRGAWATSGLRGAWVCPTPSSLPWREQQEKSFNQKARLLLAESARKWADQEATSAPQPAPGASWVVATPGRVQGAGAWAQVRKEGEVWVPSQAESQPRVSCSWTCAALTRLDIRDVSLRIRPQAAGSGSVASVSSSVKRRQDGTLVLVFSLRCTKRHRDRRLYTYLTQWDV